MSKQTKSVSSASNVNSSELKEEIIRARAYQLYEQRGREDGHELDDWLQAETEVMQEKQSTNVTADQPEKSHKTTAA